MPIRAYFAFALLSLFVAGAARADEMEPADADALKTILTGFTGSADVQYHRVACRWKVRSPAICTYHHKNGQRDSFAWFKAAKVADVLLRYRKPVVVAGGLEEVSIQNFECGASLCVFD